MWKNMQSYDSNGLNRLYYCIYLLYVGIYLPQFSICRICQLRVCVIQSK